MTPANAQAHTADEWRLIRETHPTLKNHVGFRIDSGDVTVCSIHLRPDVPVAIDEANARTIVTAVNTHADAVELAREVVADCQCRGTGTMQYIRSGYQEPPTFDTFPCERKPCLSARSLLAKSEGRDGT